MKDCKTLLITIKFDESFLLDFQLVDFFYRVLLKLPFYDIKEYHR